MSPEQYAQWMLRQVELEACIYQDDVVDSVLRNGDDSLLKENAEGNLVLGRGILDAFLKLTRETIVWVKPDRYWRFRVPEDEEGREARG
jgi:hypothetical protein